jgi:hypothetical protein
LKLQVGWGRVFEIVNYCPILLVNPPLRKLRSIETEISIEPDLIDCPIAQLVTQKPGFSEILRCESQILKKTRFLLAERATHDWYNH